MADDLPKGLAAAVEAVGRAAPGVQPSQPSLFGGADDEEPGPLGRMATRRGPGRPRGARNRSTDEMVEHIKATGRDPLLVLRDWANADVLELARHLSCNALDAAKLQMAAVRELAPYVHSKKPVAIQGAEDGFTLVVGSIQTTAQAGSATTIDLDWESVEPQGVSATAGAEVGQTQSDGSAQTKAPCGVDDVDPLIADQSEEAGDLADEGGASDAGR